MEVRVLALIAVTAAALSACAAGTASGGDVIEIEIEHSAFDPAEIEVARGSTVTFVIQNNDPIPHEFILGDAEVQLVHERGIEPHHGSKPGEVSIPAGTTATTTYTFDERGQVLIGCHLPGHYDYGMRGAVEVR